VTLLSTQIPQHSHALQATTAAATTAASANGIWAVSGSRRTTTNLYTAAAGTGAAMNSAALAPAGGSQPHDNLSPYLAVNFCIALQGIYPARN
jgi:microcystin-dependent protein